MGCGNPGNQVVIGDPDTTTQRAGVDAAGRLKTTSTPGDSASAMTTAAIVSVGTSQVEVLAANANRKHGLIQNLDSSDLFVRFADGGANVHVLPQNGALQLDNPNFVYTGAVWAIRAAATGDVGVTEA